MAYTIEIYGVKIRVVEPGDTIEPDDFNAKKDILAKICDELYRIVSEVYG